MLKTSCLFIMAFGEELLHFWKVWRLFDMFQDQKNAACFLSGLKQLLPVIYEISNSCFHNINLYTWNQLFAFHLLNVIGQGELNISLCSLDLKALNSKIFSLCLNMQICVEMYLLFLLYTSFITLCGRNICMLCHIGPFHKEKHPSWKSG